MHPNWHLFTALPAFCPFSKIKFKLFQCFLKCCQCLTRSISTNRCIKLSVFQLVIFQWLVSSCRTFHPVNQLKWERFTGFQMCAINYEAKIRTGHEETSLLMQKPTQCSTVETQDLTSVHYWGTCISSARCNNSLKQMICSQCKILQSCCFSGLKD